MKKEIFIDKYKAFNIEEDKILEYMNTILEFEKYVGKDIEETNVEDIKSYFEHLIETNQNNYSNVVHFTRYYYYVDMKENYIHMTKYFNTHGVLENIIDRITLFEDKKLQESFIKDIELPPFGTDIEELPKYTKEFMEKLNKYFPKSFCNKILAGNNHRIPKESFDKEKELYQKSESFETYLKERHKRKVQELQEHLDNNKIWFEQIITKEAVAFVRDNQEVLSGILENDKLYVTKIPYDINNYLKAEDEKYKRYYACHCTFVRENILEDKEEIPKEWCYCSAGFAKHPFETILDQPLNIKLLKTPIDGDMICRFEIDLSNIDYKK